jgi:hypothetical protein
MYRIRDCIYTIFQSIPSISIIHCQNWSIMKLILFHNSPSYLFLYVIIAIVIVNNIDGSSSNNTEDYTQEIVDISSTLQLESLDGGFVPCPTTVSCPAEFPECLKHSNGTTECFRDICSAVTCRGGDICIPRVVTPCGELWDIMDSTTEFSLSSTAESLLPYESITEATTTTTTVATVLPLQRRKRRLCASIPQCVPNACRDNLLCSSQSVCELDMNGRPLCRPIVPPVSLSTQDGVTLTKRVPTCEDIKCVAGSICQFNTTTGLSMCQKSNLCGTLFKTSPCTQVDRPICIAVATNNSTSTDNTTNTTRQCVPDPCRNKDTVCTVDGSCRVDSKGQPLCLPIPDDNLKGIPPWWTYIQSQFMGSKLSLCSQRRNKIPSEGDDCLTLGKTCFFGQQDCASVGPFPSIRCDCVRKKWTCDTALDCPLSFDTMFS